tara:strand:+ start:3627 stop:3860 length:234 start_codon:yes stop_codon:yes gene_type:complete
MPVDVTEQLPPEELLAQFRSRYEGILQQNKELAQTIKQNETQALKLLGAIETLEYLNPPDEGEQSPEGESPEGTQES